VINREWQCLLTPPSIINVMPCWVRSVKTWNSRLSDFISLSTW